MPMEIYGEANEQVINIVHSPVVESVCAIHLLTDPAHHQFELKWAEEMLTKLSLKDKTALENINQFPNGGIELLNFVLDSGELYNIENFVEHLKSMDILDFYFFVLNESIDRTKIQKAFTDKKERYKIQEKIKWIVDDDYLMHFFDASEEIKDGTVHVLQTLLDIGFHEKLESCKEKVNEGIEYVNGFVGKDSIESILEKISGRPRKNFAGYREYILLPSYFISPWMVRVFSGDRLYTVFDCRVTQDKKEALLEELSSILKVIDDKSRMEILRLLVSGKNYGKAISDIIGISTPTVSHHLDILKNAGFVKEEKIRNIKYFYADKDRLKKIIEDINKYFFSAE